MAKPSPPTASVQPPLMTHYQVGLHVLQVSKVEERWGVTVDAVPFPTWFMTHVEAWEAGVREADRLDRAGAR